MEAARQAPRPGSRAPRVLARCVRLCALRAAALLLGGATSGAAETGPGVALSLPGGGSTFIAPTQISAAADVAPRTYTLRAKPGEAGETLTHGGLSVRGLLVLTGLDPDAVAGRFPGRSIAEVAVDPEVIREIADGVAEANQRLSRVEQPRRIAILHEEWQPDTDVLTPTMKLKRRGVLARYGELVESLYAGGGVEISTDFALRSALT